MVTGLGDWQNIGPEVDAPWSTFSLGRGRMRVTHHHQITAIIPDTPDCPAMPDFY